MQATGTLLPTPLSWSHDPALVLQGRRQAGGLVQPSLLARNVLGLPSEGGAPGHPLGEAGPGRRWGSCTVSLPARPRPHGDSHAQSEGAPR